MKDSRLRKVVFAETPNITSLQGEVREVVKALGHPTTIVTDQLTVGDLPVDINDIVLASETLDVHISMMDRIWEVAKRLKEKR